MMKTIKKFLYSYLLFLFLLLIFAYIFYIFNMYDNSYKLSSPSSIFRIFFNNLLLYAELILIGLLTFTIFYYILTLVNVIILSYNIVSGIIVYGSKLFYIFIYGFFELSLFIVSFLIMLEYSSLIKFILKKENNYLNYNYYLNKFNTFLNLFLIGILNIFISSILEYYTITLLF